MMLLLDLILRRLPKSVGWIVLPEARLQFHRIALLSQQLAIFGLGQVRFAFAKSFVHTTHRFIETRLNIGGTHRFLPTLC